MNITPQTDQNEFKRILTNVMISSYEYKFLKNYIDSVTNSEKPVYSTSVINILGDGLILIVHGEVLYIYGENWSENQFLEIQKEFDLNSFKNYLIMGNAELVNQLMSFFGINSYVIEKERIFYKAEQINILFNDSQSIRLGEEKDGPQLAELLKQYYHEEYKGLNDKSIEEMSERVDDLIKTRKIYILENPSNEILCFCTLINPDIGILYTKDSYRNKGLGKALLSYSSAQLIKENNEIYLMTDKQEIASNNTCLAVGFIPFYYHTLLRININAV